MKATNQDTQVIQTFVVNNTSSQPFIEGSPIETDVITTKTLSQKKED